MVAVYNRAVDRRAAVAAVMLLALLNLLSMAARYVLPGVQMLLQSELGLTGRETGALSSAFFIVFMLAMPVAGWMGDHWQRKPIVVASAIFWCVFTLLTAASRTYGAVLLNHAIFAAGEAVFAVTAPTIIADFYPEKQRSLVMSLYATTVPAGTALGYAVAGRFSAGREWRMPFVVVAIAGVVAAALAACFLAEPVRGAVDTVMPGDVRVKVKDLATNSAYMSLVIGAVCLACAMVGIMVWLPTLLVRAGNLGVREVTQRLGVLTLCDGVAGVVLGGLVAHRWLARYRGALYAVSACAMVAAVFFGTVLLFGPRATYYPAIAGMQFCFFVTTGPMAAAFLNAVDARVRASALAFSLFAVHALGDSVSPTFIGWVADRVELRAGMEIALLPLLIGAFALHRAGRALSARVATPKFGTALPGTAT